LIELTVLRTKIEISPFFFSVLTAFLLADKNGIAGAVVLFSLLHELGHFLALLCVKTMPRSVRINLFGIGMHLPEKLSTAEKCFVLMAGFSVNFILAAVLMVFGKNLLGYINLAMGIFTALPLSATDGGSILKTVLEEFAPQKGERIFGIISRSFLAAVSVLLIISAFFTKNYFLFIPLFYMVLCAIK